MNLKKKRDPNIIAGLSAAGVFLILFILLDWSIIVSLLIAVGIFFGVYNLAKPVLKIGDIELSQLEDGIEIQNIYIQAIEDVASIRTSSDSIQNPVIKEKSKRLASIGQDILNYLENNPKEISRSRHFLTYYLPTGEKIVDNYLLLKKANVSEDKFVLITERTEESLDLLTKVYKNQRDGYHKNRVMDLEVQTELLERTIQLGGDEG